MSPSREEKIARGVELTLLVALLVLLAVALARFLRLLDRLDVSWTHGLPVGVLFLAAAYLTWRRIVRRSRIFRTGKGNEVTGPEKQ